MGLRRGPHARSRRAADVFAPEEVPLRGTSTGRTGSILARSARNVLIGPLRDTMARDDVLFYELIAVEIEKLSVITSFY